MPFQGHAKAIFSPNRDCWTLSTIAWTFKKTVVLPSGTIRKLLLYWFILESFGGRKRLFHALSGRCEGYFHPQSWLLDSFDRNLDLHKDRGAVDWNYTKVAVVLIQSRVVWRQKTFVSCPFRAMRRLFSASIEAAGLFQRELHGQWSVGLRTIVIGTEASLCV